MKPKPAFSSIPAASWLMVGLLLLSCRSRFDRPIDVKSYIFKQPVTLTMAVSDANLLRVASTLAIAEIQRIGEAFDPLNNKGKLYRLNTTHKRDRKTVV